MEKFKKFPTKKRSSTLKEEVDNSDSKDDDIAAFRLWSMKYDVTDEVFRPEDFAGDVSNLLPETSRVKKLKGVVIKCSRPPPERTLPTHPGIEKLRGLMGECSEPFTKALTRTDVADGQCRLNLTKEFVEKHFIPLLREEEKPTLNGLVVTTYDPQGNEYTMKLKQWVNGKYYVLNGENWKRFCHDHGMAPYVEGTDWLITVWVFRRVQTEKICFAIFPNVCRRRREGKAVVRS